MFCHKCGMENSEEANNCISCGELIKVKNLEDEALKVNLTKENTTTEVINQLPNSATINEHVRSPLVWSILVTIFGFFTCCINPVSIVVGIIAIVFSSKVDEKLRRGDYTGAKSDAKTATILNWVGFGFLVLAVLVIGLIILISFLGYGDISTNRI